MLSAITKLNSFHGRGYLGNEVFEEPSGIPTTAITTNRAVARSENPGGLIVLGGENLPPLVEIGLTDLPKTGGGGLSPPSPPLATALHMNNVNKGTPT